MHTSCLCTRDESITWLTGEKTACDERGPGSCTREVCAQKVDQRSNIINHCAKHAMMTRVSGKKIETRVHLQYVQ